MRVTDFAVAPDTILPSELNTIQDDYETLHRNRFVLISGNARELQGLTTATDYLLPTGDVGIPVTRSTGVVIVSSTNTGLPFLYWDPEEWKGVARSRTLSWRLRSALAIGPSADASTQFNTSISAQVRRMTGTNWIAPVDASFVSSTWADVAGSTMTVSHPALTGAQVNVQNQSVTAPATAGWYAIFFTLGANVPANVFGALSASLTLSMT